MIKAFRSLQLLIAVLFLIAPASVVAGGIKEFPDNAEQVCNVEADFFLGIEDYPAAVRSHQEVVAREPRNALAHYHLGFAYGMRGRYREELAEYRRAVGLGLTDWTLLLNLGLAYFEQGHLKPASDALRLAVLIAPEHAEPHFNLALVYYQLHMSKEAKQEALTALALSPRDADIRNTVALVLAERGEFARAREEWSALLADNPAYEPAKINLTVLDQRTGANAKRTAPEQAAADTEKAATGPFPRAILLHRIDRREVFHSEAISHLRDSPDRRR